MRLFKLLWTRTSGRTLRTSLLTRRLLSMRSGQKFKNLKTKLKGLTEQLKRIFRVRKTTFLNWTKISQWRSMNWKKWLSKTGKQTKPRFQIQDKLCSRKLTLLERPSHSLKKTISRNCRNSLKKPLGTSIRTTMESTRSTTRNSKRSRMSVPNTSQSMKSIWSTIRQSSRILRGSRSNGFRCSSSLKSLIKLDCTRLRLEFRKMSKVRWERLTFWKRRSRNSFMLSNSLKSQVLKLLRLGPSKRKGIKWEAPKEDLARKALLSTGNNCQLLSKAEKPTAGTIRWLDPTLTVKQASVAFSANLRTTLQATGKVAFRVITQPHLMPTKFQRQVRSCSWRDCCISKHRLTMNKLWMLWQFHSNRRSRETMLPQTSWCLTLRQCFLVEEVWVWRWPAPAQMRVDWEIWLIINTTRVVINPSHKQLKGKDRRNQRERISMSLVLTLIWNMTKALTTKKCRPRPQAKERDAKLWPSNSLLDLKSQIMVWTVCSQLLNKESTWRRKTELEMFRPRRISTLSISLTQCNR